MMCSSDCSYDVMFLGNLEEILHKFRSLPDTRVLFSAEQYCWPDERLQTKYPKLQGKGNAFLNSGGFIGNILYLLYVILRLQLNHAPLQRVETLPGYNHSFRIQGYFKAPIWGLYYFFFLYVNDMLSVILILNFM